MTRLIQLQATNSANTSQSSPTNTIRMKDSQQTHDSNDNVPLKTMNDEQIAALPRGEAIKMLKLYSIAKGVAPPEDFLRRLDHSQLQTQLHAARDQLVHDENTEPLSVPPPPPPIPNETVQSQPVSTQQQSNDPPQPQLNEAATKAHNLYGVNTAVFNPSPAFQERSKVTPPAPKNDDEQADTYDVVALKREEQYLHCRVEAHQEASNVHTPSFMMKLIYQLRKGDPSAHILPYDLGVFKSADILGHEKDLPEEAEDLKKWIVNISSFKTKILSLSKFRL